MYIIPNILDIHMLNSFKYVINNGLYQYKQIKILYLHPRNLNW